MKVCKTAGHVYPDEARHCPKCWAKFKYSKWLAKNPNYQKEYAALNRDKLNEYSKNYYQKNREKCIKSGKNHDLRNPGRRERYNQARKTVDPVYKLKLELGNLIRGALYRKKVTKENKTLIILGASIEKIHTHLILSALRNYGMWLECEKFHIDHIIPPASAKTEEEVYKLNHYTNLQWLYPIDNLKKGASIPLHAIDAVYP